MNSHIMRNAIVLIVGYFFSFSYAFDCDEVAVVDSFPFAGAIFSVASYGVIFYLYYVMKIPTLKRHPTCKLLHT